MRTTEECDEGEGRETDRGDSPLLSRCGDKEVGRAAGLVHSQRCEWIQRVHRIAAAAASVVAPACGATLRLLLRHKEVGLLRLSEGRLSIAIATLRLESAAHHRPSLRLHAI